MRRTLLIPLAVMFALDIIGVGVMLHTRLLLF